MKLAVLITPALIAGALATSAAAQTLTLAPSTTVSSALLSEPAQAPPTLPQRRALALAAFERPQERPVFAARSHRTFEAPVQAKAAWTADDGLRIDGTRVAYRARF